MQTKFKKPSPKQISQSFPRKSFDSSNETPSFPSFPPFNDLPDLSKERPNFPTFALLVEQEAKIRKEESVERKPQGLFEGLLRTRADILLEDALKNRDKYDPEVVNLLVLLYEGKNSFATLPAEEQTKLDEATALYFARPEVNNPIYKGRAPKSVWKPASWTLDEKPETSPLGEDGLPAYWWLK
jgi:hypothetical protein